MALIISFISFTRSSRCLADWDPKCAAALAAQAWKGIKITMKAIPIRDVQPTWRYIR